MKIVLKNQRTMSAIVALALAAIVTLVAGLKSYGETANEGDVILKFDDRALLERAIADLAGEAIVSQEKSEQIVKIFNEKGDLLETATLLENEAVENAGIQRVLNKAEFLSAYGNTVVYRVSQ